MDLHAPQGLDTPTPRTLAEMARAGLIIETEGRTRLGDEFRIAASRLHSVVKGSIAAGERCGNMVLVTSTRPAEGKSFAALNMAASLARTGVALGAAGGCGRQGALPLRADRPGRRARAARPRRR